MGFVVHELLERFLIPNAGVSHRAGGGGGKGAVGIQAHGAACLVGRLYETFSLSEVLHCFCRVVDLWLYF